MLFISIIFVIFFAYNLLMKLIAKSKYKPYNSLLLLILVSLILSIALGSNYMSSLSPENDGIAINNLIAYWIIGDDGWTIDVFKNYFIISAIITLFLPCVYFFQKRRLSQ